MAPPTLGRGRAPHSLLLAEYTPFSLVNSLLFLSLSLSLSPSLSLSLYLARSATAVPWSSRLLFSLSPLAPSSLTTRVPLPRAPLVAFSDSLAATSNRSSTTTSGQRCGARRRRRSYGKRPRARSRVTSTSRGSASSPRTAKYGSCTHTLAHSNPTCCCFHNPTTSPSTQCLARTTSNMPGGQAI